MRLRVAAALRSRLLDARRDLEQGLDDKIDSVWRRLREDRADYPPGD
jgi:hypothetical protein